MATHRESLFLLSLPGGENTFTVGRSISMNLELELEEQLLDEKQSKENEEQGEKGKPEDREGKNVTRKSERESDGKDPDAEKVSKIKSRGEKN